MRHLLCAVLLLAAAPAARVGDKARPNTLTPKEVADGWLLLFDGKTPFGWTVKGNAKVENGELVLSGTAKGETVARTTTAFSNCEFRFQYRYLPDSKMANGQVVFRGVSLDFKTPKPGLGPWVDVKYTVGDVSKYYYRVQGGEGGWTGPFLGGWKGLASPLEIRVGFRGKIAVRNVRLRPVGLKSIFNGKDLTGWKVFPGKKSKFTVTDKGELHVKDGPGDLQTEGKWKDFVLQLECRTNGKHLNSGVFFRCRAGEYQNGYEAQIRNQFTAEPKQRYKIEECDPQTHTIVIKEITSRAVDYGTGAIYRRMPARLQASKDNEWFTMTVVAQGAHLATWVNGIQVVDWDDCRPRSDNARKGCCLNAGHISLQGHDPTTDLNFRNFRIAELPGAPK
jgi:hypothetical protein